MKTISLATPVRTRIEAAATDAGWETRPGDLAARLAPLLPSDVHEALAGLRHGRDGGALLIEGVGPGDVSSSAADYRDLSAAAPLLLGLVSLIATPVAARDEWDGGPLTDIKVTAGLEKTVSSKGEGGLPLHQESQHLAHPPDGLALLTVRGGCPTCLAATTDIVEHIRETYGPSMLEDLRAPVYRHRLPDSFSSGPKTSAPTPVLLGPDDMPELKVDLTTTEATTPSGRAALAALSAAVDAVAADTPLEPGYLLVFDNRRWLHGRGKGASVTKDRWLVRSLFVFDGWRLQGETAEAGHDSLAVFA